jgi:predicted transcriptional regulator
MSFLKKNWYLILPAIMGMGAMLLLGNLAMPPKEGKEPEVEQINPNEDAVNINSLQIKSLWRRLEAAEENIRKIYNNQTELNRSISELLDAHKRTSKTDKENRAYIAMIYDKVLSLELQVQSLGGGFNVRPKPQEEEINPLMGMEELPRQQ